MWLRWQRTSEWILFLLEAFFVRGFFPLACHRLRWWRGYSGKTTLVGNIEGNCSQSTAAIAGDDRIADVCAIYLGIRQ